MPDDLWRAAAPYEVHPAAECFRLMNETELADLVEDIREHGLQEPIKLGQVGEAANLWLIDGRNRFRACRIAEVQPDFETLQFDDEAGLVAYVQSTNAQRRNLTAGERAMSIALLYPEGGKGGPGHKDAARMAAETAGISSRRIAEARQVARHSRELALAVRDGPTKLDAALDQVRREQADRQSDATKLATLRQGDPDLAALVDEDRLSLAEAFNTYDQRVKDAERIEQNKRETLLRLTEAAYSGISAWCSSDFAEAVEDRLSDDDFREQLIRRLRLEGKPENIRAGAAALAKILGRIAG